MARFAPGNLRYPVTSGVLQAADAAVRERMARVPCKRRRSPAAETERSRVETTQTVIRTPQGFDMGALVGPQDSNLRRIEAALDARITVRGDTITIEGDALEAQMAASLFSDCIKAVERDGELSESAVERAIELVRSGDFAPEALREDILLTYRGRSVRPKTAGQATPATPACSTKIPR